MVLLICGDYYQLSPVSKDEATTHAFTSPLWQGTQTVELTEIVRQGSDGAFAQVLARMRLGQMVWPTDYAYINAHSCRTNRRPEYSLYPYHTKVNEANEASIARMPGALQVYAPKKLVEEIVKTSPEIEMVPCDDGGVAGRRVVWPSEPPPLELKLGVPVRCTKNVYKGQDLVTFHGQRGVVVGFTPSGSGIRVRWDPIGRIPGQTTVMWRARRIKRQPWPSVGGNAVIASITYFPLTLAFASTIHSAQGQTITSAVDMEPCFKFNREAQPGSVYVALSRVSRLALVRLVKPLQLGDVRACPIVRAFFQPAPQAPQARGAAPHR